MKNNFVFFYTNPDGNFDYRLPLLLTKSIKHSFQNSYVYQLSDKGTPKIEGVDEIFISQNTSPHIMLNRAEAYRDLNLTETAVYLDTDMFIAKNFDIKKIIDKNDAIFLRRSFMKDRKFNTKSHGLDLKEYENLTLDKVYPYIGCFFVTKSFRFWIEFVNIYKKINKKFYNWYGDQEVIRIISEKNLLNISEVQEYKYACPPKYWNDDYDPYIIHFKGKNNKEKFIKEAIKNKMI